MFILSLETPTKYVEMKNIVLVMYLFFLASCACYYEDVRREGEVLNPTSYVYDFPEMEVRLVLDSCFALSTSQFPFDAREKYQIGLKSLSHISGELFQEPPILYFRKRDEKIFPVSMNLKSYVLKNRKGHFLDAYAEYVLRIDSVALKKTRVSVLLHKNYVSIGRKLGLNPISLGIMVDRNKDVPSCTIEEYEILKYIGNKLGQEGMPPIHYPKALTKEEILEHIHDGSSLSFPFTEKDIYGW